jgi:diguanylate cyclase
MTSTIFWASLAVTLAVGVVIGLAVARFGVAVAVAPPRVAPAMVMHHELRRAIDGDELVLHYQPKVELGTGRVSCLEALVRWQHPERGLLTPPEFVPVAEQHPELIESLTRWVLGRALADYTAWTRAGNDWTVAVNITAQDLGSPDFAGTVGQILGEAGVRPDRLHLEVAETALAGSTEVVAQVVRALAGQGILMSIDDFGTGFTSPSRLRSLQVSEVKIARTFVAALPGGRATVRALIDLGSSLGCLVTAVGVEWQDIADWLADAGCDHAQGYLWLRPRSWTEVAQVFGAATASRAGATQSAPAQAGRESHTPSR